MKHFFSQKLADWLQARLRPVDAHALTQRNVYILPTRAGWMLALTLLVLLLASINFQLNLGYVLTFLLAGSAVVGMHMGHRSLTGLILHVNTPQPQFAGQAALLEVHLQSQRQHSRDSPRHGIGLSLHAQPRHWAWTDVAANGRCTVQLAWTPPGRGLHALPLLTAETRFPLGSFRVWTVWRPSGAQLVYPKPEVHAPALPLDNAGSSMPLPPQTQHSTGDWDGVRSYRVGDPLKNIIWKKAAKAFAAGSHELVSRDHEHRTSTELWLDEHATGTGDAEARLSRLCAWVLAAQAAGLVYGLRVGTVEISPDNGLPHQQHCLTALALH